MIINSKEKDYLQGLFIQYEFEIDTDITHCEDGAETLKNKLFPELETYYEPKKITNKKLADYLGVSEQAVKQYPKIKTDLMKKGLLLIQEEK